MCEHRQNVELHELEDLLKKFFSIFAGHFLSINIPFRKEEGYYTYSFPSFPFLRSTRWYFSISHLILCLWLGNGDNIFLLLSYFMMGKSPSLGHSQNVSPHSVLVPTSMFFSNGKLGLNITLCLGGATTTIGLFSSNSPIMDEV
jgi:hypothetical protein